MITPDATLSPVRTNIVAGGTHRHTPQLLRNITIAAHQLTKPDLAAIIHHSQLHVVTLILVRLPRPITVSKELGDILPGLVILLLILPLPLAAAPAARAPLATLVSMAVSLQSVATGVLTTLMVTGPPSRTLVASTQKVIARAVTSTGPRLAWTQAGPPTTSIHARP